MVKQYFLLACLFVSFSCNDAVIKKFESEVDAQRIDISGYYVSYKGGSNIGGFEAFIFFENGTCKFITGNSHKSYFSEDFFFNRFTAVLDEKIGWGIWKIENELIIIRYWGWSNGGGLPKINVRGEIISDTSFCLEEIGDSGCEVFVLYHSNTKPDSTNNFIR